MLPVLPALLAASGTGGRRRPAGIVTGLTLTHTITIVGVASVVDGVGVGVGDGTLRSVAIAFLALFGLAQLVPRAAESLQLRVSFLQRLAPVGRRGDADGFWSGLPAGGALGFVYAPCAGPILAAVISVSASSGTTGRIVAVGVAPRRRRATWRCPASARPNCRCSGPRRTSSTRSAGSTRRR